MQLPLPLLKNVVLVGGGHSHALVLRALAMKPVAGARITLINPDPTAPYTGMLPGFVAGHYTRDELDIDLVKLSRFADTRFVVGRVTSIDPDAKTVTVPGRPPIPYDVCSIDVGITSAMPTIAGFNEFATPAKPLGRFAQQWESFVERHAANPPSQPVRIVVAGGGIGGTELAMAMHHRLSKIGVAPSVTILDRDEILREVGDKTRIGLEAILDERGIIRRNNAGLTEVTQTGVVTEQGETIDADLVVGVAGARPYPWLSKIGLETHDGFITVSKTLQTVSDPSIFAVGDCAHMGFAPRPKAGVFAVRQAPVLTNNIVALLQNRKLKAFDPQADYLKLISLGRKSAGADKYQRFVKGPAMWRLKNKIDRSFMDKLNDLEAMKPEPVPKRSVDGLATRLDEHPALCGGCGAKVGVDVLTSTLDGLPPSQRADISSLPGDDAALLHFGTTNQVLTTDQLRAFTTDPVRFARISTLHALGDIWAMGASPQAVLVTVTLPQLGHSLQQEWLAEIMAGTNEALIGTGAEVVGGHTSMGAELSIGYTVTGTVSTPLTLAGAASGNRLVLTRPIGSGVLFAAEMSLNVRGGDITRLLDVLEKPQGDAAAVLVNAGASSMTDVTGFGLAGHLFSMLRQSSAARGSHLVADLDLDAIRYFDGAIEASKGGVRSHLYESNAAAVPVSGGGGDERKPLLFDPQTAGGLLAAVPADAVDDTIASLRKLGHDATTIGAITEGDVNEIRI